MKGSKKEFKWKASGQSAAKSFVAEGDWISLQDPKKEKPIADVFFTAYSLKGEAPSERPLTFVFNGGPGAASAYLHLGALGPFRVEFQKDGKLPSPPVSLVQNSESWLEFTDLVFVDPVGTGFSRPKRDEAPAKSDSNSPSQTSNATADSRAGTAAPQEGEFYQLNRDLNAFVEFIKRYLSRAGRWSSPIWIAGESYGGFRVAKLCRKLQENSGIVLSGAILISPALELNLLNSSDYDLHQWLDVFPSFAASALHHGKAGAKKAARSKFLDEAETFACESLPKLLLLGKSLPAAERSKLSDRMAELIGLSSDLVKTKAGRISFNTFCRELLRDQGQYCGLYDASLTTYDPFPDRESYAGPDPTLFSIDGYFSMGINHHLREWLGVSTERDYVLLSFEVFESWKVDEKRHAFEGAVGAVDDFRYAMSLNPKMQAWIVHGYYDLITPYFSSKRLFDLMKLPKEESSRVRLDTYEGGHMFYTWEESRKSFTEGAKKLFESRRA